MLSENAENYLSKNLPFFSKLSKQYQDKIRQFAFMKKVKAGQIFVKNANECTGLLLIEKGILRVYTVSDKGRKITLYRLYENDSCIFSASCVLNNIDFEVNLQAETNCELIVIPIVVFDELNKVSVDVSNFIVNLMSNRFSDVMWVLQQYVFNGTATRIATFLLSHMKEGIIMITHEQLASETGTSREVVTRLLKKMHDEGIIFASRGRIKVLEREELSQI